MAEKKYIKDMDTRDSKKAQAIVNEVSKEGENFKTISILKKDLDCSITFLYQNMKTLLAEKFNNYVMKAQKPSQVFKTDLEKRSELSQLQTRFYFQVMKATSLQVELDDIYLKILNLREKRKDIAKEIFKKYNLDNEKSYKVDYKENKIYEVLNK